MLLLGAGDDQRRRGPADPDRVHRPRCVDGAELLVDHQLLDRRGPATPRSRPVRCDVAGLGEPPGEVGGETTARRVLGEERPHVRPVRLGLGRAARSPRPTAYATCQADRQVGESGCDGPSVRRLRPHPVLCAPLRLLRLRDVDRPRPPDRRLRRRLRRRPRAPASRRRASAKRRRCSSAAARRRCSPAASLARIVDAIPRADGAEVTVECNPDSTDAGAARRAGRGGREPRVDRGAVDGTARARRAQPHARPRQRRARGRRRHAPPASSASTSTSSTARRARRSTTGGPRSTARSRSSPST